MRKRKQLQYHKKWMRDYRERNPLYAAKVCRECKERDPRRPLLYAAKVRAKKAGVPFELALDDIVIPKICPVLGIPLKQGFGRASDASPSLDRIKPTLGYIRGNVRVISFRANTLRSNATLKEFRALVADCEKLSKP